MRPYPIEIEVTGLAEDTLYELSRHSGLSVPDVVDAIISRYLDDPGVAYENTRDNGRVILGSYLKEDLEFYRRRADDNVMRCFTGVESLEEE